MPILMIYLIGAGSAGLIMFMGWLWRWRHVLSAATTALITATVVAGLIMLWAHPASPPVSAVPLAAPTAPTLSVITWGESDASSDAISATDPVPSHIVFARIEITAGDTALSIPALGTPNPENLLWLGVRDTGRATLTDQAHHDTDGTLWLPSHSAELVPHFGDEPLMFPDAACTTVEPDARCQITLVWEIADHGTLPITSITLLPAHTDPSTATPLTTITWPTTDTAQPACNGPIHTWCTTT